MPMFIYYYMPLNMFVNLGKTVPIRDNKTGENVTKIEDFFTNEPFALLKRLK